MIPWSLTTDARVEVDLWAVAVATLQTLQTSMQATVLEAQATQRDVCTEFNPFAFDQLSSLLSFQLNQQPSSPVSYVQFRQLLQPSQ
jgi:hypothetical protein